MTSSIEERVRQVLALVFNLPDTEVGRDAAIMRTPGWDSLGHANLMLAIEEEFEVTLSPDVVVDLQSLDDIVTYLEAEK
jgi:acyl carrier protein